MLLASGAIAALQWQAPILVLVCFFLGGLPLISWLIYRLTGQQLAEIGTGNVSVSAAFYHGGKLAGILAVLLEAFKGIAAVELARVWFPSYPAWELIALISLVVGRYWIGKGAGTTNVVWGFVVHDWCIASLVFAIGGITFTIVRSRQLGRIGVLILFPLLTALLYPQALARIGAAIALALLLGWIYQKIPDDLDLPTPAQKSAQSVFRFVQGHQAILSLDDKLDVNQVGQKAATLSDLKRQGYAIPPGWVLPFGDNPEPLIKFLQPSDAAPLVVRSSAVGEDSEQASAAGQYETVLNVTTTEALQKAIALVFASYKATAAQQYRRDRGLLEKTMAVLIQPQIRGIFSGVAFSRDPITHQDDVVIEAMPGGADQVVLGQVTPEQYRVSVDSQSQGEGSTPQLIWQVACLARQLESDFHGVPQDIEWSYDGQKLWLLQSRPITTMLPLWTRKIAAEVIPGLIHPLTWSINRPLTCGVWGEIFTLVLGNRNSGLEFNETARLQYSRAYFNASLLGQIFLRMGLPSESLEFLTMGAKFSQPPLRSTLQNVPGLMRLLWRELMLAVDFERDYQQFAPALSQFAQQPASPSALLEQVDSILTLLKRTTYYSILAPLSASLRQAILQVPESEIDRQQTPEVAALRSLTSLAAAAHQLLSQSAREISQNSVFNQLAQVPQGKEIIAQFDQLVERYGYLSQVGTDIAVPTWRENSQMVREIFVGLVKQPTSKNELPYKRRGGWVQSRVDLRGRVTEVYSQLLAQLRWCFVALEQVWLQSGLLSAKSDIFFLEFDEVQKLVTNSDSALQNDLRQLIEKRRSQLELDNQLNTVPPLVYGNSPPPPISPSSPPALSNQQLQGIAASPGQVEGRVKVLQNLLSVPEINRETILVVPYTDSGWAPILAQAGGLIAEVGGRLSHGAIVAREYKIPAVMDIHNAIALLPDGTRVRIDGQLGIVEIL